MMSIPPQLQRVTTEYVEAEDRLRLSGALVDGRTVVLWVTQRLFNRVLAPLTRWLDAHGVTGPAASAAATTPADREMLQEFAQQSAQAALTPQPRVPAEQPTDSWLVDSMDIGSNARLIRLTFKACDGRAVGVTLEAEGLRQWLAVVHSRYRRGGWATSAWPAWMEDAMAPAARSDAMPVH